LESNQKCANLIGFHLHNAKQSVEKLQGKTMPAGDGAAFAMKGINANRGSDSKARIALCTIVL
jgi:hypothetical protein